MIIKKIVMTCLAGTLMLSTCLAYAEDDETDTEPDNLRVILSLKGWNESWSSWQTVGDLAPNGFGTIINTADNTMALIGGVTVKYKNLFVSGNYAPRTSFEFTDINRINHRSESDLNVGYYLHPQMAVSLGYKAIDTEFGPSAIWTHEFVTLGVAGSSRIGESSFFMYENGAVSLKGDTTLPYTLPSTITKGESTYSSLEAGFGFAATRQLTLTMGYKYQQVEVPITFSISGKTINTRDSTTGFIFGAAYSM